MPRSRLLSSGVVALAAATALTACSTASSTSGGLASSQTSGSSSSSASAAGSASASTGTPSPAASSAAPDCTVLKCLALTFDDGPSPLTDHLLTVLSTKHVAATFFLLGNQVVTRPEVVRRMNQLGFEIGNHTWDHPTLSQTDSAKVTSELARTQTAIANVIGRRPTIMRPPYGATSKRVDSLCAQQGLAVISWSTSPEDWNNHTTALVTNLTLQRAARNAIILMHDTHQWTVDAIPNLIDQLRARGYTLVTVSQLLGTPKAGHVYP